MNILPAPQQDGRRIEVVADGLPLFHGAQLAIDTTLVSALKRDGRPRPGAADIDGAACTAARRRKEATYPELSGRGGRTRLVVVALEVGGRWSREAWSFVVHLARARSRAEPEALRKRAQQAWHRRFVSILAVAAQRAFCESLLERQSGTGSDGDVPSTQRVLEGSRYGW